ncbi:MAG TPA: hypothetical protein VFA27_02860 [Vicinamibacterales bacterium]|nr:hypothetical protein [Vicinamibacterales bacterium]
MLARAASYVDRFEHDFGQLISDEDYEQTVTGTAYRHDEHRRTQSEMLFLWMPQQHDWLTVRNVLRVDGRAVPDSEGRLSDALASADHSLARLRQLRDESARFNIGRTFRNLNYPTMALRVLESNNQPRFRFDAAVAENVDGRRAWKIAYREIDGPTMIQDEAGTSMYAHGFVWILDDGTVVQTRLDMFEPTAPSSFSIVTSYARDATLALYVPARMREVYTQRPMVAGKLPRISEQITATATYTHYRRFETSGRIIPQSD